MNFETFNVTVTNPETGESVHTSVGGRSQPHAGFVASSVPLEDWTSGSAAITFYQIDPELDTFSFGYYSRLEDAQADGLRSYREHTAITGEEIGQLVYLQSPKREADPDAPDIWNIVDGLHSDRQITMFQIVKCVLWTSRQTSDSEPLPEPVRKPGS
jgi:hypothetical protein